MSVGGEATPERAKGGDHVSWANTNLIGQKIKKIHAVNSPATNELIYFKKYMQVISNFFHLIT
jgi:hypothetical protein